MSVGGTDPQPAVLPNRRGLALRLAAVAGAFLVLVAAIGALPGLDEIRRRFEGAAPGWLLASMLLQAASCLSFVAAFRGAFCRTLGWRLSYGIGMTIQGTNVLLPAGGASGLAVGAWALRRLGMPAERVAVRTVAFFLITSAASFMTAAVAGTALALGIVAGDVPVLLAAGPAVLATAGILVVLALPRLLPGGADAPGRRARLFRGLSRTLGTGIRETRALVRAGDPILLGGAIGWLAFDVAALAAAFAAVGTPPPVGVLVLAYIVGQLGGTLPLPGGIGGTDGGLIAALVIYGTPLAEAAAAVLAYRAFHLLLPASLGALSAMRLPVALARAADVPPGRDAADDVIAEPVMASAAPVPVPVAVPAPVAVSVPATAA